MSISLPTGQEYFKGIVYYITYLLYNNMANHRSYHVIDEIGAVSNEKN